MAQPLFIQLLANARESSNGKPVIRHALTVLAFYSLIASGALAQTPRLQTGGAADQTTVVEGLDAQIFAQRLGDMTDMIRADDGTLFVADRTGGRIFRIIDRDRNGRAELTQPLPHRFDSPGGLALIDDTLFVSDRGGVWRIDPDGGTPVLLAPFARAGASDSPAPMIALPSGTIRLGLNRNVGTTSLIDIDPETGRATAVETSTGRILSFARVAIAHTGTPPIWLVLERDGKSWAGPTLSSARPVTDETTHLWLDPATGEALIARGDRVSEARAAFEGLSEPGRDLLSGLSGGAGVMIADERGLFVAEPGLGRVWRIHAAKTAPATVDTVTHEPSRPEAITQTPSKPDLLRGSGIDQASIRGPASTMGPASTLPPAEPPTATSNQPSGDVPDE
ncbi:MAG: hypothetical protein AAF926_01545 [Pseudomonadota bacterium]